MIMIVMEVNKIMQQSKIKIKIKNSIKRVKRTKEENKIRVIRKRGIL